MRGFDSHSEGRGCPGRWWLGGSHITKKLNMFGLFPGRLPADRRRPQVRVPGIRLGALLVGQAVPRHATRGVCLGKRGC